MSLSAWLLAQPIRIRRTIALAAGPILVVSLWAAVIHPILHLFESHHEWLAHAEAEVARDRGLRAAEPELRAQLSQIERSPLLAKLYPTDPHAALGTALQADVGSLLSRTGISAQSIAPLPGVSDEVIERASIRIVLTVTIDQLRSLLSALQSQPRLIRVDEMVITAPQSQMPQFNPPLTVAIVLCGFRLHGVQTSVPRLTQNS